MEPENSVPCAEVHPPVCILIQVNQSTHFHNVSLKSTLILSSHLCLGFLHYLFPSGFPTKKPLHISLLRLRVMTQQTLFDFNTANNFW
jgi:hypothetical protein